MTSKVDAAGNVALLHIVLTSSNAFLHAEDKMNFKSLL